MGNQTSSPVDIPLKFLPQEVDTLRRKIRAEDTKYADLMTLRFRWNQAKEQNDNFPDYPGIPPREKFQDLEKDLESCQHYSAQLLLLRNQLRELIREHNIVFERKKR
jgi:hypothetical protein